MTSQWVFLLILPSRSFSLISRSGFSWSGSHLNAWQNRRISASLSKRFFSFMFRLSNILRAGAGVKKKKNHSGEKDIKEKKVAKFNPLSDSMTNDSIICTLPFPIYHKVVLLQTVLNVLKCFATTFNFWSDLPLIVVALSFWSGRKGVLMHSALLHKNAEGPGGKTELALTIPASPFSPRALSWEGSSCKFPSAPLALGKEI